MSSFAWDLGFYGPPIYLQALITRILQRLATAPDGATLNQLLPAPPDESEDEERRALRWCWALTSTFGASLELAKQGELGLEQEQAFAPIHIARLQTLDVELCYRLYFCFKFATTNTVPGRLWPSSSDCWCGLRWPGEWRNRQCFPGTV